MEYNVKLELQNFPYNFILEALQYFFVHINKRSYSPQYTSLIVKQY